jgi:site-specific recombinase
MQAVEARPELVLRVQRWWDVLLESLDITTLLADFGFAPRSAFTSEVAERLRRKLLPGTPETIDAAELFTLLLPTRFDAQWLNALSEAQIDRLTGLLSGRPARHLSDWQHKLIDAITYCTAQIRATGFAPELRLRMSREEQAARPFHALPADIEALQLIFFNADRNDAQLLGAVQQYRNRLDDCRRAVNSIYLHLDQHGISIGMVFRLRQLRERFLRVRELLDCLLSSDSAGAAAVKLLARRVLLAQETKSLRALVAGNSTLLAAKMAERSAETGARYITRSSADYRDMLGKAMGGGAITGITTLLKFMVVALGLSAFWSGFWAAVAYSASFIVIQLLHFTLATKQPAMTAPAMAAKVKDLQAGGAVDAFVDEVTFLVRSQVAAVLGNVFMVVPAVLLINAAIVFASSQAMLTPDKAAGVLASLSLWGPTLLWAAFTGTILFTASLIAGWAENWFVLHKLDSAMRFNPRITAALGIARAARWASFMRENISGFASNISLGFMLGLIPPVTGFLGLELDVRHVTLSAGQLAAAAASIGPGVLQMAAFWWCVAAIPLIGALNLGVSFYLAFRLALQAHNVTGTDRARLRSAIVARLGRKPLSFLAPV